MRQPFYYFVLSNKLAMMIKLIRISALIVFLSITITGCKTPAGNSLKFAFITDIHVGPGSPSERNFSLVIREVNSSDADMVIITGDLSNSGSDAELNSVKAVLDSLTKPYLIIPGNHETNWSESAGQKIVELWGDDRFITEYGNYVLVGFSTGPFMKMGDGHVKPEDIPWLRSELANRMEDGKQLVAFAHYPLADGLDNWFEVTDILKEYGCLATFCGHGHRLGLHNFDGIPGVMGRALVQADPESPGYNIVELRSDSVFVFEKLVGEPIDTPAIQFSYRNPDVINDLPITPRPDFSINEKYSEITESFIWADTAAIFSGICLAGDSMFVYGNSLGWVKAINYKTNQLVWEAKFNGSIFSSPVATNDIVVFGTIDDKINGLDIRTGKVLWQLPTSTPVLAAGIIINDLVYIGGGSEAFYCIDVNTGIPRWVYNEVGGLIQGKPAVYNGNVVFGAWDRHLYCISAATGTLNWKWNNDRPHILYSPGNIVPVISNNKVFIVAPDRFMTAIDLTTGKQVWRTAMHQVRESMGISPDGREVFAKLMNDSIVSVSAAGINFKTNWAVDAGILYDHNPCPVLSNDKFVIGATKNGLITAIDRKGKSVAWMHKTGNSSVNEMVFDFEDNIWFSSTDGRIIRLSGFNL